MPPSTMVRSLAGTLGVALLTMPTAGWSQEEDLRTPSINQIQTDARELRDRHAASRDGVQGGTDPAPDEIQAINAMDRKILDALSAAQRRYYENRMRDATVLFFDNNYQLALPLFREIAARVKPLGLLYMYGLAAYRAGMPDLAITNFQTMLTRDARLHRVRMDLALAYIQKGDREQAKLELARALESDLPGHFREQVESLLARLDGKPKKFSASLRLSGGIQYDGNISARTDELPAALAGTKKYYGLAFPINLSADTLYFLGPKDDPGNIAWRTQLGYYRIDYNRVSAFDFSQLQLASGPEYFGEGFRLRAPVSITHRQYEHDSLSNLWSFNPDATFQVRDRLDFKIGYGLERENYIQDASRGQTHTTHGLTGTPSWRLNSERLQIVALEGGISDRDAKAAMSSYQDWSLAPSYFTMFNPDISLYLQAKYLDRRYEGNASLAGAPEQREDGRFSLTAMVSRPFMEDYTLSATYNYTRNQSNTSIYDYDKAVFGINLGYIWNN